MLESRLALTSARFEPPSYDGVTPIRWPEKQSSMLNIASCGLNCGDCAAYKATQANDKAKLSELAVKWGGDKGLKAKDMLCDGCTSDRVYKGCTSCAVRNCTHEQGVKVCSQCGEYPCGKLEGLWKGYNLNPEDMKANLAKVK